MLLLESCRDRQGTSEEHAGQHVAKSGLMTGWAATESLELSNVQQMFHVRISRGYTPCLARSCASHPFEHTPSST